MAHTKRRKGLHGLMKPVEGNKFIHKFVGLCAKMYALLLLTVEDEKSTIRKGKGVPKAILKQEATFEHYERMAEEPYTPTVTFNAMRSNNHVVRIKEMIRKMLSCLNDKVFAVTTKESRPLGKDELRRRGEPFAVRLHPQGRMCHCPHRQNAIAKFRGSSARRAQAVPLEGRLGEATFG